MLEMLLEFLADVPPDEQGDEGSDRGALEPGGHLAQAFVDGVRIKLGVEFGMDGVRDILQIRVD